MSRLTTRHQKEMTGTKHAKAIAWTNADLVYCLDMRSEYKDNAVIKQTRSNLHNTHMRTRYGMSYADTMSYLNPKIVLFESYTYTS